MMKLSLVLQALQEHKVEIQSERTDEHGNRVIVLGAALPMMPYAGRYRYATLVISPPAKMKLSLKNGML